MIAHVEDSERVVSSPFLDFLVKEGGDLCGILSFIGSNTGTY